MCSARDLAPTVSKVCDLKGVLLGAGPEDRLLYGVQTMLVVEALMSVGK